MKTFAARLAMVWCALLAGCFYPPMAAPSKPAQHQVRLTVPYDLAWDAVNSVIKQNNYRVRAQDPNHGIIEAQGTSFTTKEADCGKVSSLGGTYAIDPTSASSAEYNFRLKADGPEACIVTVEATFVAPLHVPFRPYRDIECVSRGTDEVRLLSEVQRQAAQEHRPTYKLLR
jgi:hypothetical protein